VAASARDGEHAWVPDGADDAARVHASDIKVDANNTQRLVTST
jgi:hypothetical protein